MLIPSGVSHGDGQCLTLCLDVVAWEPEVDVVERRHFEVDLIELAGEAQDLAECLSESHGHIKFQGNVLLSSKELVEEPDLLRHSLLSDLDYSRILIADAHAHQLKHLGKGHGIGCYLVDVMDQFGQVHHREGIKEPIEGLSKSLQRRVTMVETQEFKQDVRWVLCEGFGQPTFFDVGGEARDYPINVLVSVI